MTRILVYPDDLRRLGQQLRRAAGDLRSTGRRLAQALRGLRWEARSRGRVDADFDRANRLVEQIGGEAEELARFLEIRAAAFEHADREGAQALSDGAVRWGTRVPRLGPLGFLPAVSSPLQGWSRVIPSINPAVPIVNGLNWFRETFAGLFGPAPAPEPVPLAQPGAEPAPALAPEPKAETEPEPEPQPEPDAAPVAPPMGGVDGIYQVPLLKQNDPRWSDLRMAPPGVTTGREPTVGNYGCALTAAAMSLQYLGIQTDPADLIARAQANDEAGLADERLGMAHIWDLYWARVAAEFPGVEVDADSLPGASEELMAVLRQKLEQGPVIVGTSPKHYVVVTGYEGDGSDLSQFRIHDPGQDRRTLLEFTVDYDLPVEYLQFFRNADG